MGKSSIENRDCGMVRQKAFFKCIDQLPEDIVVENQRGICLLGYPFFSAKLLVPRVDPTNFQLVNTKDGVLRNISNASIRTVAELYPLVEKGNASLKWFVLMEFGEKVDMDDQGWVYSWHFSTERWKSKHGFVRRRVWARLPEKGLQETIRPALRPVSDTAEGSYHSAIDDQEWLIQRLMASVLDRKRFESLDELCRDGELALRHLQDEQLMQRVRDCFQYGSSAERFTDVWLPNKIAELSSL